MTRMTRRRFLEGSLRGALGSAMGSGLALGLGAGSSSVLGCGWTPGGAVSEEALDIHRRSIVFDLHVDTLLWQRLFGYDPLKRHQNRLPLQPFGFHFDLPRAREGGLDGAVMGIVVNPAEVRDELMLPLQALDWWEDEHGVAQTLATLDLLAALADEHADQIAFVRRGSDLAHEVEHGRFAAFAGLEGAHGLEGDIANLQPLYERGLRMVGLVHFQANEAAYPMTAPEFYGEGLTDFGMELVGELQRLRIVIDLAHLNGAGVRDALSQIRAPCAVSHTACRALHDDPRNLSDHELHLIGRAGGVVGIAAGRRFVGSGGIAAFLDHVEHALDVAGPHAVALGTDYDGFIVPTPGMGDVRSYPLITQGLLDRKRDPEVISQLLGGNAQRLMVRICG
jgi:membrane dipeptidase